MEKVEDELKKACLELIDLIDMNLLKNSKSHESNVFFHKMKGDYYRYLSEFYVQEERMTVINNAHNSYYTARNEAEDLETTDPIRLGLALNFSIF